MSVLRQALLADGQCEPRFGGADFSGSSWWRRIWRPDGHSRRMVAIGSPLLTLHPARHRKHTPIQVPERPFQTRDTIHDWKTHASLLPHLYAGGCRSFGGTHLDHRRAAQNSPPDYAALVASPDRTPADRQTDQRRDPLKLLVLAAPIPGMKVLDMGAGGGYSTELMARAVAPTGVVYGQNPADLGERAKARFEARLKTPAGGNIVSLARPFDDPVPPELRDLDLITFLFSITTPPTCRSIGPR